MTSDERRLLETILPVIGHVLFAPECVDFDDYADAVERYLSDSMTDYDDDKEGFYSRLKMDLSRVHCAGDMRAEVIKRARELNCLQKVHNKGHTGG